MRTGNASGSNYYGNKEQGDVKESIKLPEESHELRISGKIDIQAAEHRLD